MSALSAMRILFLLVLGGTVEGRGGGDDVGTALGAEAAAVDGEVIGEGIAPLLTGEEVVIVRAGAVDAADGLAGLGLVETVVEAAALHAGLGVGIDENGQQTRLVTQHIVGAAADDDAVLLGGEGADDLGLRDEDAVGQRRVGYRQRRRDTVRHGGRREEEAACGALFASGGDGGVHIGLFGGESDELVIVEGDAELVGDPAAYLTAAAAVLTADGDDKVISVCGGRRFHNEVPPARYMLYCPVGVYQV